MMGSLQKGHGARRAAASTFSRSFCRSGAINRMMNAIRGEMSTAMKNHLTASRPFRCARNATTTAHRSQKTTHSMTVPG